MSQFLASLDSYSKHSASAKSKESAVTAASSKIKSGLNSLRKQDSKLGKFVGSAKKER